MNTNTNFTNANNEDLFMSILNPSMTADDAAYSLRESIFKVVRNNTAINKRTDKVENEILHELAKEMANGKTFRFTKAGNKMRSISFITNDEQVIVQSLLRFIVTVYETGMWVEYISGNKIVWHYEGEEFALYWELN